MNEPRYPTDYGDVKGALIEFFERNAPSTEGATGAKSVIAPNDIRINGQSLWCDGDNPIIVHELSPLGGGLCRVTLTLLARKVVFAAEGDL